MLLSAAFASNLCLNHDMKKNNIQNKTDMRDGKFVSFANLYRPAALDTRDNPISGLIVGFDTFI